MPENSWIKVLLLEIVNTMLVPLNILLKLFIVPIMQGIKPEFWYLVPLMQIFVLYFLNGDMIVSIKLFLTIHCFLGFIFTKFTYGSHRIQTLWTEGC